MAKRTYKRPYMLGAYVEFVEAGIGARHNGYVEAVWDTARLVRDYENMLWRVDLDGPVGPWTIHAATTEAPEHWERAVKAAGYVVKGGVEAAYPTKRLTVSVVVPAAVAKSADPQWKVAAEDAVTDAIYRHTDSDVSAASHRELSRAIQDIGSVKYYIPEALPKLRKALTKLSAHIRRFDHNLRDDAMSIALFLANPTKD